MTAFARAGSFGARLPRARQPRTTHGAAMPRSAKKGPRCGPECAESGRVFGVSRLLWLMAGLVPAPPELLGPPTCACVLEYTVRG